jgi:hypothetical protein
MLFEPEVWERILIVAAAYAAVASLVHLMRQYRRQMIVRLKAGLIKRQMAAKSARPPASRSDVGS